MSSRWTPSMHVSEKLLLLLPGNPSRGWGGLAGTTAGVRGHTPSCLFGSVGVGVRVGRRRPTHPPRPLQTSAVFRKCLCREGGRACSSLRLLGHASPLLAARAILTRFPPPARGWALEPAGAAAAAECCSLGSSPSRRTPPVSVDEGREPRAPRWRPVAAGARCPAGQAAGRRAGAPGSRPAGVRVRRSSAGPGPGPAGSLAPALSPGRALYLGCWACGRLQRGCPGRAGPGQESRLGVQAAGLDWETRPGVQALQAPSESA